MILIEDLIEIPDHVRKGYPSEITRYCCGECAIGGRPCHFGLIGGRSPPLSRPWGRASPTI